MAEHVSIHVLTHNSRPFLEPCLDGISSQLRPADRVLFIDCASQDGTREWLQHRQRCEPAFELLLLDSNRGYSGGHNAGLAGLRSDRVLLLNPDVRLAPEFLQEALRVMRLDSRIGAVTGKLLRADDGLAPLHGPVLDSTGIIMTRNQRHLDRGAGQQDTGQHDATEEVFGASGAAPLYRRRMLDDVTVSGEVFDETFFAYREDVDLAWRARLLGWRAMYAPRARAFHRRRVRPENRKQLPAIINRHSVRNRFLLRIKNQTLSNLWRTLLPGLLRDAGVIGYVMLREPTSLPGLVEVARHSRSMLAKRRRIMARRRASGWEVDRWFLAPTGRCAPPDLP